ncbi:hypothetical protein TCAL_17282 [Tigriopus californicus]|uniref:Uncharacterized protein n=1 Tax=Tigriopus californicus TaxID=6832 RepID=A0A553NYX1_TIGCA|nr:hypothetical protein TCAL_17282 [Tigriopus californicus]
MAPMASITSIASSFDSARKAPRPLNNMSKEQRKPCESANGTWNTRQQATNRTGNGATQGSMGCFCAREGGSHTTICIQSWPDAEKLLSRDLSSDLDGVSAFGIQGNQRGVARKLHASPCTHFVHSQTNYRPSKDLITRVL